MLAAGPVRIRIPNGAYPMQAIVIGDDPEERELMSFALRRDGWAVAVSGELDHVLARWSDQPSSLIVLAVSDAVSDYTRLVRSIRETAHCGLMLVVDRASEQQVIQALRAGADLVLRRPVSATLLAAQATALGRRTESIPAFIIPRLELDRIVLDPSERSVSVLNAKPQHLTRLEFQLLYVLMTNRGQVVPTETLVERVWGYTGEGDRELVRGLVSRLRRKLETEDQDIEFIENIPGVGYRFSTNEL